MHLQDAVLKALEEAKASGIENPLDAEVVLPDPDGALAKFKADLADIFGVSRESSWSIQARCPSTASSMNRAASDHGNAMAPSGSGPTEACSPIAMRKRWEFEIAGFVELKSSHRDLDSVRRRRASVVCRADCNTMTEEQQQGPQHG